GDTLSGIAARAGTSLASLASVNHLRSTGVLLTGTILRLPSGSHAPHVATSHATATSHASVADSISHWSAHYGVDVHLVRALAWQESGYQSTVVSPAGATGVMQVTPTTWSYVERYLLGQSVPHTTDGNVRVGVAFLAHLLHAFGSTEHALAAYYQGEESVRRRGILPVSRSYVANIRPLSRRLELLACRLVGKRRGHGARQPHPDQARGLRRAERRLRRSPGRHRARRPSRSLLARAGHRERPRGHRRGHVLAGQ